MKRLDTGTEMDGFRVGDCIHSGGMADIYRVHYANGAPDPGFPMVMKVPKMTAGDGAENLIGFEVEHRLLQVLTGPMVPRFVAAGDLARLPYLVMEYIEGQTLERWIPELGSDQPLASVEDIARLGAATARALHGLHQQDACHLDLKPANVMIRPNGQAVLLDFGLSWHAHYPDLLAEEFRKAVGSPAWIAPEQIVGVRGDPRSDIFALGVMLYQLATGRLPFGAPRTQGGLRQRMWADPRPPRALRPELPKWLQEVILRCLEPEADQRYPSAAHLAFDLSHPQQVQITELGERLRGAGFWEHARRWLRAAGKHYQPSPLPTRRISEVPIVMVAVPHTDVSDETLFTLRQAVGRSLGARPGARLACVTVVSPGDISTTDSEHSEVRVHQRLQEMLRRWAQPLDVAAHQVSFHVLEDVDVARALLRYAEHNQVSLIVMGAATHGLQLQRFLATVPIRVAMDAPCSIILVKAQRPYLLGTDPEG